MKRIFFSIAALLFTVGGSSVLYSLDLEQYRNERPVIVVFYRVNDEPRAFSFNLALSTYWNRIENRNIVTIDVGPGKYDLDRVAEQLNIGTEDFAIVTVGVGGSIIHRTTDPGALAEILMTIDQEQ